MTETVIVPPGPSMKRVRGTKKFLGLKEWNLKKDLGLHFLRACSRSVWRGPSPSSSSPPSSVSLVEVLVDVTDESESPSSSVSPSVSVSVSSGEVVLVEVLIDVTDESESGGGSSSADAAGEDTATTRATERDPVRADIADPFLGRRLFCRLRMIASLV
ncbi:hypothetical protein ACSDR0_13225 [Streptosporangium sp. G11]|uniref:hypothetical protein n=1 Tax=Streptosporangium sp. G11 TaxID=3436926 RepID=UPI003EC12732